MKNNKPLFFIVLFLAATLVFSDLAGAQGLKINEIDYDQVGTDTSEFIELYYTGTTAVNLGIYQIILYNGTNSSPYDTIQLPAMNLIPNSYFVICGNTGAVPNCDMALPVGSNIIQNGSPDAVALLDTSTATIVDVVSYEGTCATPYVEGTGVPSSESDSTLSYTGMSRFPDGADTDDNATDFHLACITPGSANTNVDTNCLSPVSTGDIDVTNNQVVFYPNPSSTEFTVRIFDSVSSDYEMILSDVLEKAVMKIKLTGPSTKIQRGELKSGIYFYEVRKANRVAAKGKFLIQD